MKVAFDENMPAAIVRIFEGFSQEGANRRLFGDLTIERAQDYYPAPEDPDYSPKNDAPWVERFAAAGGQAVISGDTRMRKVPHERLALVQTGLITIFFPTTWSGWKLSRKCSLLMHWWPQIVETIKRGTPGFYMVPAAWPEEGKGTLTAIPTDALRMVKIEAQKAARDTVRKARRAKRGLPEMEDMFHEHQDQSAATG